MKRPNFRRFWRAVPTVSILFVGALIAAFSYSLFLVPFSITSGGVGGISIIINSFTGLNFGTLYLVLNIPLLILGYFQLGGWRFLSRTVFAVLVFSAAVNLFTNFLPQWLNQYPINDDILLNAIYGGILGGIGGGLLYRSGGTLGGTSIISRILRGRSGIPMSQLFLYTDGLIILAGGLVFGWEIVLYGFLSLFLNGLATDYTLEGPSVVRTVTIITDHPEAVSQALIEGLNRGVSRWEITGMYTGRPHSMLMCTVYRSQVNAMRQAVVEADNKAFLTIGTAHQALGEGFRSLKK
ncbi:MAG: YitT family protein [Chloroflexota bacterium]|jgi:uncharacterized membrane-anchored protein YitT (DUF2179 family)